MIGFLKRRTIVWTALTAFAVALIVWGSGLPARVFDSFSEKSAAKQSKADDLAGALEYEFNMTKDPALGKIPEGIREKELEQADSIVREQLRNDTNLLGTYSYVGPENLGGRTRALAYDLRYNGTTNRIILAGGVSGGLFKSVDDGASWVRKSPSGDLFSVSALAQDPRPAFRDTWYYGGGEFTGNSASATGATYRGKGVYKSTDNGETWTFLPSSNTGVYESFDHRADYVYKLVVSPTDGFVYMAAADAIYRSTDGGTTWSIVLTSGSAGFGSSMATDIVVTSGGSFYAAFSGTSNTLPTDMPGVWRSATGASGTWTKIAGAGSGTSPAGWNASGAYGRVVLAIAPSLESRVYALYWNGTTFGCGAPAPEAEMFYWNDMTSTWTEITATLPDEAGCLTGNDPFAVQTGYDLVVAVKPDDPATVFIGGTNAYRSTTTGASWTRIGGYASPASYALYASSHPDIHAFAFPPTSSTTMLSGNDGGIQRTTDNTAGTVAWTQINTGYRTYQYYYVVNDPRTANTKVMGGAQDNGTTRNVGGAGSTFESVFGGDGVAVGLTDLISGTQYEYVGSQLGRINRRASTTGLGSATAITPTGEADTGLFVTLFKVDPDNSQTVYYANDNILYRTTSGSTVTSATWTSMTGIATAVGAANDITAIALTRGTYSAATSSLFIGTSNGRVYRLDDPTGVAASTAPVDITGGSFPVAYVSSIAVDPQNDDTIMVTFSNYGVTSIWWTGTANTSLQADNAAEPLLPTWTNIESNLTLPSIRSSAIVVTPTEVLYFVGTSVGLYGGTTTKTSPRTAPSGGAFWSQEGPAEIGNAVVSSLDLRPADNKLLVGTHGSGMWFSTFLSPTAAQVSLSGRVTTSDGRGIRNARLTVSGGSLQSPLTTVTGAFGYYSFEGLRSGETYVVTVDSKRFTFQAPSRSVTVLEKVSDFDFVAGGDSLTKRNGNVAGDKIKPVF